MFNTIQKQNEKKSVISFDNLSLNNTDVEVSTVYNVYNTLYGNKDFLNTELTGFDVLNRREALIQIFSNRAEFLINNALVTTCGLYADIYAIKNKYRYMFNIDSYMRNITMATLLDYSNTLCTEMYNILFPHYEEDIIKFNNKHTELLKKIQKLNATLLETFQVLLNEVHTIYLNAGIPDVDFTQEIEE